MVPPRPVVQAKPASPVPYTVTLFGAVDQPMQALLAAAYRTE